MHWSKRINLDLTAGCSIGSAGCSAYEPGRRPRRFAGRGRSRMSTERRRSPRVALLGKVHGHIAALDVRVKVREMSLGGLSMETDISFPVGSVHDFSLTLGDGAAVLLKGEVVYSRGASSQDGS